MDNSTLPAKALATLAPDTRSQQRQRKRWIDNFKDDLHQRASDVPDECVTDRQKKCSLAVGNLRVKRDWSKKKKKDVVESQLCVTSLVTGDAPHNSVYRQQLKRRKRYSRN